MPSMNTKICLDCERELPLEDFRCSYGTNRRQNRCKRCYSARERARIRTQFFEAYENNAAGKMIIASLA